MSDQAFLRPKGVFADTFLQAEAWAVEHIKAKRGGVRITLSHGGIIFIFNEAQLKKLHNQLLAFGTKIFPNTSIETLAANINKEIIPLQIPFALMRQHRISSGGDSMELITLLGDPEVKL
jgi:hypothetical protein